MKRLGAGLCLIGALALATALQQPAPITIDYPAEGSIFPPEFPAPTFLWREAVESATEWLIDVEFADGSAGIHAKSRGERVRIGDIDPRAIGATNELPKLTPQQAAARSWTPDPAIWAAIKRRSVVRPAVITITGMRDAAVSRGRISIGTSRDPVGAPIFYRDVPLMPSEVEKGVIKPLAAGALPLVGWRLRNVGEPRSRLLMEGLHTCANCHSFSRDGKTLGMDMDGPRSDKGMYAIAPITPRMSIRNEDVVTWGSYRGKQGGQVRVGFMSQVSPDGQRIVTTVNADYYVANFKTYRFLQVFYPTRGILAWYSRAAGRLQPLPGADDPRYVHTNAVWSPDGKYLVFARAEARDPYPEGRKLAESANDPNETPIQYDLYRIPFNEGRGGRPEPIAGASRNGMSNSFPKVSPDGRWIVYVQCRNGQLMRPDSQLYIVPATGGQARRMRCNTPLMNSWHSFSPNGRWLVFSSKSRSPYTQMFLTHLDEEGNDSPAILIENATAANRAVNIPEFVNIPADGLLKIDAPAAEFYRLFDSAWVLGEKGRYEAAIAEWNKALNLSPGDARAHYNLGVALARTGQFDEAITQYQQALKSDPDFAEVHANLGVALSQEKRLDEAITHFERALKINPGSAEVHTNLGVALVWKGQSDSAITHFEKALEISPGFAAAHRNLGDAFYHLRGKTTEALAHWHAVLRLEPNHLLVLNQIAWVLATNPEASIRNGNEAVELAERAVKLSGGREPAILDTLAAAYAEVRRFPEAAQTARRALALAAQPLTEGLKARIALYEARTPFRETQRP